MIPVYSLQNLACIVFVCFKHRYVDNFALYTETKGQYIDYLEDYRNPVKKEE